MLLNADFDTLVTYSYNILFHQNFSATPALKYLWLSAHITQFPFSDTNNYRKLQETVRDLKLKNYNF
jgi:hypothetical protein